MSRRRQAKRATRLGIQPLSQEFSHPAPMEISQRGEPFIDSAQFGQLPESHQKLLRGIIFDMRAGNSENLDRTIPQAVDEKISTEVISEALKEGMHYWSKERGG